MSDQAGWVAQPDIGAHRVIGDGRTACLVRPDALIDWWCHPTFAGEPVLWSLLDRQGGRAGWRDARRVTGAEDPAAASTRTVLRGPRGRFECWDALLPRDHGSILVRLVRAVDEPVTVVHELVLGGFETAPGRWVDGRADVGGRPWRVIGGSSEVGEDPTILVTTLAVARDRWSAMVIAPATVSVAGPVGLAEAVARFTDDRAAACAGSRLPQRHGDRAAHALSVVEAATDDKTGAVVASPTTSLPEAPGHDRQFDYRYSWLRDSSLAMAVVARLGRKDTAARYLRFLRRLGPEGILGSPVTDVEGGAVPREHEVSGIAGWAGSQPIRVGNAASEQVQFDALGSVLEALWIFAQSGGRLTDDDWAITRALADRAAEPPGRASSGVWEFRQARPLVSADIGRWITLDRALWISRTHRPLAPRASWRAARAEAHARVIAALRPDGSLPQAYEGSGHDAADASSLVAVIAGLLPGRDPRAARLVDVTIDALESWPFLYRYEPGTDDGFTGIEGAFVPASWWAVSALAVVGRLEDAEERADALCASLPALLPEEVDPHSHAGLGNVPLVWSHMEAARALYLVEAAARRRRYGRAGFAAWRAVHLLRDLLSR